MDERMDQGNMIHGSVTCCALGCMNDPRHSILGWFTMEITNATLELDGSLNFCDEHFDAAADEVYEGKWTLT